MGHETALLQFEERRVAINLPKKKGCRQPFFDLREKRVRCSRLLLAEHRHGDRDDDVGVQRDLTG